MAAIFKYFIVATLFVSFTGKGNGQCSLEEIKVSQSQTGAQVQGKPEWAVTVSNPCPCTVRDLKLSCAGFQTTRDIDPSVLAKSGDECLVNNGHPLHAFSKFNFSYVWDNSFPFKPLSLQVNCS